jgi:hypothetical protein
VGHAAGSWIEYVTMNCVTDPQPAAFYAEFVIKLPVLPADSGDQSVVAA